MNLWWATFVAMVLISIVVTAVWHALKKQEADSYNLHSSIFYVFGIFCQRGKELLKNQLHFTCNKI
jgi:hypothetical protein